MVVTESFKNMMWVEEVIEDTITTAIQDRESKEAKFTISPNPVADKIFVNVVSKSVTIYNLNGKVVKSVSGNVNQIDISNIEAGVYVIKVLTADNKKLINRFFKN